MKKTNLLSIQKFFYIIYVFVMLFGLTVVCDTNFSSEKSEAASGNWSSNIDTSWLGSGTLSNPYLITSAKELAGLANRVNSGNNYAGKYFIQTANIDLSTRYWTPIGGGSGDYTSNYFQGRYFGNGHTISGLYINKPNDNCVGLFGAIKNANISGVQIKSGTVNGKGDVGGVVGYAQGEDGSFSGSSSIDDCSNGATINGVDRVGGIVGGYQYKGGYGFGLRILNCYNTGSINGKCMVGGILGGQNNNGMHAEVQHCYNTGTIKGTGGGVYSAALAGGIVGRLAGVNGSNGSSSGYVIDCWSTGTMVTGPRYIGGIAGELFYPYTDMVDKGSNYFCTVGRNWGDGHNENAYWVTYVEASTLASNAKKSTWYTNANNWENTWDMTNTWEIKSGSYPTIKIGYMTLDGDGGTFSSKQGFTISGDTATIQITAMGLIGSPPNISKTGYTFGGWWVTSLAGETFTEPVQWFVDGGNLNLFYRGWPGMKATARWTANKYTVSYNLDGGRQGTYQPTSWTYDVAQQISNPTRTGYTFDGWTASGLSTSTAVYGTSSNPTTKWSNANTKVKASSATGALYFKNLRTTSGTVTLKANWSPIEYTLTFNPNGGSVSPPSKKVFYNSAYGDLPTPTKKGYSFTGWYTSPTGGSKVSSTTKMGAADTTIYAHWTANTYTVNYTLNGGSYGTYHPTSWTYDVAQQISNPKKTHYDFEGWTASNLSTSTAVYGTTSNPTTKWSNASTKVKASSATGSLYFKNLRTSGTVTLTANWTGTNYTLTYNANGGSVSPGTEQVKYQGEYGELPIPTRQGYIFTGWYTSPTEGSPVSSTDKMTTAGATIYAHWAETWANHISPKLEQDTSDSYYKLSTSEDLARLIYLFNYTARIDVLKMKFKLTNHIDMSKYYWEPLGTTSRPFSALIDGRGYTIKGLRTISQSLRKDNGGDNSGFIGVSGSYTEKSSTGVTTKYKATIKNIYFEDISINGRNYVAGVVGSVLGDTTISAIAVVGEIYGTNIRGGIAAYAPSTSLATISDCLVDVSPSNIVIRNNYITATNSVNYSTGKLAKTSGTFTNWIENLTGMKYTMLPKGLTWIASGG